MHYPQKKTQKPKSFGFENTNPKSILGLVITQITLLGINILDPNKVGRMLYTQKIILGELERPTLASRVPLFLLGHFLTNECEISDFCL